MPTVVDTEDELDEVMTRPSTALTDFMRTLEGDVVVIGAGGKMGPSLCVLARRAAEAAGRDVAITAVSRFGSEDARRWLEDRGVRTVSCDVMDREAVRRLPEVRNVIYLVGMKFGTSDNPALTWAVNALAPAHVSERYADSRVVALSTGNVYPLVRVADGGVREDHSLTPLGEYANAAVARERIFGYYTQRSRMEAVLVRLNYAVDLRYGVLVDLGQAILAGRPVDLTMGYFNCIWQRDANDMIIRMLDAVSNPASALNLTGPETLRVRQVAERLATLMDRPVRFTGEEAETALLSDASAAFDEFGSPPTSLETVLQWTAHWLRAGRPLLGKPTHFEVRDGQY